MDLNGEAELAVGTNHHHDTHATPPQAIFEIYRRYQQMSDREIAGDLSIVDFARGLSATQREKIRSSKTIPSKEIWEACQALGDFQLTNASTAAAQDTADIHPCEVYEHLDFPGLRIFPSLLPPRAQTALVSKLMHRDLADPTHKTNLHEDYHVPYPAKSPKQSDNSEFLADHSLFSLPLMGAACDFTPHTPGGKHKPLTASQALQRKLRYLTLGAQYDWPTRAYPSETSTGARFPADIRAMVSTLFPRVKAESGVVLIYSPKDYMPVHRDVSEQCVRELCSFSLGCDGLFILALPATTSDGESHSMDTTADTPDMPMKSVVIRVRSGDMLQLDGPSRWAWHAMPKVLAGTCPEFLRAWPAVGAHEAHKGFRRWKGYMANKRINLSCRQVWDD